MTPFRKSSHINVKMCPFLIFCSSLNFHCFYSHICSTLGKVFVLYSPPLGDEVGHRSILNCVLEENGFLATLCRVRVGSGGGICYDNLREISLPPLEIVHFCLYCICLFSVFFSPTLANFTCIAYASSLKLSSLSLLPCLFNNYLCSLFLSLSLSLS